MRTLLILVLFVIAGFITRAIKITKEKQPDGWNQRTFSILGLPIFHWIGGIKITREKNKKWWHITFEKENPNK